MMRRTAMMALAWMGFAAAGLADLPDVPQEAVTELGVTPGKPQTAGFVFANGRYLLPPYTVTRRGNGIFINRVQVEQPVAWERVSGGGAADGEPAAGGGGVPNEPRPLDEDGDFEELDGVAAAPAPAVARSISSIEDLFADDDGADEQPVAPAAPRRTAEQTERDKRTLVARLDRQREQYEKALGRGEIFLFSTSYHRVNGTYGTARMLIEVLPDALRRASTGRDLLQVLQRAGVYFVDENICNEMIRHKATYPQLQSRLQRIKAAEEAEEAQRRRALSGRNW